MSEVMYDMKTCFCCMQTNVPQISLDPVLPPGLITQVQINKIFERKIVNLSLPISFNICFGCSKETSMLWLRNKKIIFCYALLTKGLDQYLCFTQPGKYNRSTYFVKLS